MSEWKEKFSGYIGGKQILSLTGESATDLKSLEVGDIIFSTCEQWDQLSRRWKQRKNVQNIGLFICDDLQMIGGEMGPTYEVIISRMRYITVQTGTPIRIIGLGVSLANATDLGEWMGCTPQTVFNFHPSVRPVPLEIHLQGYNIPHFASLMLAMSKPTYLSIKELGDSDSSIVFVPSRKQCKTTCMELINFCIAENEPKKFLSCSEDEIAPILEKFDDKSLAHCVEHGIAFYHVGLSKTDKSLITQLYQGGALQVLVASWDSVWSMNMKSKLVVVMGCQYYEGKEHRYVDYPVTDVLQMIGCASRPGYSQVAKTVLMCTSIKKEFYKKFLFESLPVESHLNHYLHDHFNAEIVTKTIENKQDAVDFLTWTFFYRRMALNPNFYVMLILN
jgi:pre-mRNA-splicing helicase BRR2